MRYPYMAACGVALACLTLPACSNDPFATAPVTGVVLCNGKPVAGGEVTFTSTNRPGEAIAGKPAYGNVGKDGRFELSTYKQGDGAIIGTHTVDYSNYDPNDPLGVKQIQIDCEPAMGMEGVVEKGSNDLVIELADRSVKPAE